MKKILLTLFIALPFTAVFSQTFMHGVGITVMGSSSRTFGDYVASGFTYSPRVNFVENDKMSVAVGIPLTLGSSVSSDYYSDYGESSGFVLNVPVIVSLNMGRGSTKENRQKFGYFFGAGFAYNFEDFTEAYLFSTSESRTTNAVGPAANGGVRFGVGKRHKNIEVRLSYMKGITNHKPSIFGVAGLFNF